MVQKRGNGEGSRPRKRPDGRWEARYYADTPDGRKRKTLYGKTRKEVADRLARALTEQETPAAFVPSNITVREFFAQYEDVARETMKRRSFETYQDIARLHLLPALGSLKLKDLTREHVQRMYANKRGAGLSAARVRRIHGVLSSALNKAVLWRLVAHNVCKEVSPPRVENPDVRPLTKDQAKAFLAAAQTDRYHALYCLALTSGMRIGEIGGLLWSEVDLEAGAVRVRRALITGRGGQTFDTPKTAGSRRTITLTSRAVKSLQRHRQRQRIDGISVEDDALVFTNTIGGPINPSHLIVRSFKPLLKRAGLPDTNFHALRHTCCCLLLMAGVNAKVVSLQLGHSSPAFTLSKYASFLPGWGDEASEAMDQALG